MISNQGWVKTDDDQVEQVPWYAKVVGRVMALDQRVQEVYVYLLKASARAGHLLQVIKLLWWLPKVSRRNILRHAGMFF